MPVAGLIDPLASKETGEVRSGSVSNGIDALQFDEVSDISYEDDSYRPAASSSKKRTRDEEEPAECLAAEKKKIINSRKRSAETSDTSEDPTTSKKARKAIAKALNGRASGAISGKLFSWQAFFDKHVGDDICSKETFDEIRYYSVAKLDKFLANFFL
jgi:hypothetical protein